MHCRPIGKRAVAVTSRVFAILLALWLGITTGCFMVGSHPSDRELVELLDRRERDIETLRLLILRDNDAACIGRDFARISTPTGSIEIIHTKSGWEEHREIMKSLVARFCHIPCFGRVRNAGGPQCSRSAYYEHGQDLRGHRRRVAGRNRI